MTTFLPPLWRCPTPFWTFLDRPTWHRRQLLHPEAEAWNNQTFPKVRNICLILDNTWAWPKSWVGVKEIFFGERCQIFFFLISLIFVKILRPQKSYGVGDTLGPHPLNSCMSSITIFKKSKDYKIYPQIKCLKTISILLI